MQQNKNGPPQVSRRKRMEQALELRLAGASYGSIAKALSVSRCYAWKLIDAAVRESAEKCAEAAEKVRTIELARLDKMRVVLWPKKSDPRTAEVLLKISERTAKLHGLDKPVKIEASGPDGAAIQVEQADSVPDLTRLSVEEIRQLSEINKKLQGKG